MPVKCYIIDMDTDKPRSFRVEMLYVADKQKRATIAALADIQEHGYITNQSFLDEFAPKIIDWETDKTPLALDELNRVVDEYATLLAKVPQRREYNPGVKSFDYLKKMKTQLGKDYDAFFKVEGTMDEVFGYYAIDSSGNPGRTLVADCWTENASKRMKKAD